MEKLLTESIENYLEFMYTKELDGEKWIKPLDMASFFSFSRSAITKASDKLNELGYIIKEKYGKIALTEKGREIGKKTYERHTILKSFLLKLGVDEQIAETDCCKIEHVISEETFLKIKEFISK